MIINSLQSYKQVFFDSKQGEKSQFNQNTKCGKNQAPAFEVLILFSYNKISEHNLGMMDPLSK